MPTTHQTTPTMDNLTINPAVPLDATLSSLFLESQVDSAGRRRIVSPRSSVLFFGIEEDVLGWLRTTYPRHLQTEPQRVACIVRRWDGGEGERPICGSTNYVRTTFSASGVYTYTDGMPLPVCLNCHGTAHP